MKPVVWNGINCSHLKRNRLWALSRLVGLFAPRSFHFVEIGVFEGDVPVHLKAMFPLMKYTGIDPWEKWDQPGATREVRHERRVKTISRVHEACPHAELLHMTSGEALDNFESDSLDVVYIDADHSYESMYHDFNEWYEKVKDGGVLCGHDYYPHINYDAPMAGGCRGLEDAAATMGVEFVSDWPYSATWSLVKGKNMRSFQKERY